MELFFLIQMMLAFLQTKATALVIMYWKNSFLAHLTVLNFFHFWKSVDKVNFILDFVACLHIIVFVMCFFKILIWKLLWFEVSSIFFTSYYRNKPCTLGWTSTVSFFTFNENKEGIKNWIWKENGNASRVAMNKILCKYSGYKSRLLVSSAALPICPGALFGWSFSFF